MAFSTTAVALWFGLGLPTAAMVASAMLAAAAFLESAFAYCLGCKVFGLLMKAGAIPDDVCAACADITLRHPAASAGTTSGTGDRYRLTPPAPPPVSAPKDSGAARRATRAATSPVSSLAHDT